MAIFVSEKISMGQLSGKPFKVDEKKLLVVFITIIAITGFQVYWLRDSYFREKKALEIRTNSLFRETARQVQDSIWQRKLTFTLTDSLKKQQPATDSTITLTQQLTPDRRTAKAASLIWQKMAKDSVKKLETKKSEVFVSLRKRDNDSIDKRIDFPALHPDDIREVVVVNARPKDSLVVGKVTHSNRVINIQTKDSASSQINTLFFNDGEGRQIMIKIDSLFNDSVSIPQLTKEFKKTLEAEKLNISFTILSKPGEAFEKDPEEDFRPGSPFAFGPFGKYSLQLGNTFPYLIRKITLPILFSLFLIGFTIFSFIVLYRTLINQQRLAAMKNEFMSNMTHELKTPIATVAVAIEALRNFGATQSPERTKEYLDISASELQRLSLLVDKVLKLSMFENNAVELRKENLDLRDLVNEVTEIMKLQFEKNNATVSVKTIGNDFMMEADRLHITSVIYNLLDNALKYSKENPRIEIVLSALPNDIIELKVTDNGIGIPKEYKWKVFDKFFRVPSGDMHNVKGYGLGLSYVSEIIKRHMGFIEVDSELGKGSAFIIKMPRKEMDIVQLDENRKIYRKAVKVPSFLKGKQA